MIAEYIFGKLAQYLGVDLKTTFERSGNYSGAVGVDNDTIMGIPAIYAAIKVVANAIASLPVQIIQRGPDGNRERLREHRLNYLFSSTGEGPNLYQTWFEFMYLMQTRLMLYRNAYAFLGKMKGVPGGVALLPVHPESVQVNANDRTGEIKYDFTWETGEEVKNVPYLKMLHLRSYTKDGFQGVPLLESQRESLALNVSIERSLQSFWGNSARSAGFFSTDVPLQKNTLEHVQKQFQKLSGPANAGKSLFLPARVKWQPVSNPLKDSESNTSRTFQIEENARLFSVPNHKVGDMSNATYSNIEMQSLEFLTHSITPYIVMWVQKLSKTLLKPQERAAGEYFRFETASFLQATTREQSEALSLAVGGTWMTQNEARGRLDMNKIKDPSADELLAQPGSTDAAVTKQGTKPNAPPKPKT